MKLRHLFRLNMIFALFFGTSCTLFPQWVFDLYGVTSDSPAQWTAQLVGGSILGFATLMWFAQKSASVETRRAIAVALFLQDVVGCGASLQFQFTGMVNGFGWLSLGLYGLLAISYGFFLFIRPASC